MNSFQAYQHSHYGAPDPGTQGMSAFDMVEGQSIDDIVSQNDKANRRRSMPLTFGTSGSLQLGGQDPRRMSMMDFDPSNPSLDDFQFAMSAGTAMDGMMRNNAEYQSGSNTIRDANNLAINTQFANQSAPFSTMPPNGSSYASPLHPSSALEMDLASPFGTSLSMPLNMSDASLAMMGPDMNMFPPAQFSTAMMESPINQDFTGALSTQPPSMGGFQNQQQFKSASIGGGSEMTPDGLPRPLRREHSSGTVASRPQSEAHSSNSATPQLSDNQLQIAPQSLNQSTQPEVPVDAFSQMKFPWTTPPGGFPSTMNANPHMQTPFKNVYSSTGFDMLGVLMRVATRPNPEIDIGSVDLSCAFVVCEAKGPDCPIVYCSENFERLTGYTRAMIVGRNCRFLQSPDGRVEAGVKRKYVDDRSVYYLKQMIDHNREAQISLINYRRGGQPFMNLLTMIPIPWDTDEVKFIVGFQVDLVEQPGSMTNRNADGSYRVNYQRGISMPSYIFNPDARPHPQLGQTISKDEVSNVLATYGVSGDTEITRRLWDKVLLENTDDVVHVLSLKGLFLYLSPSSNKVLEYDPSELVGTALSSVCHPSDIVPVTRELKETGNGTSVNVVFRIRRKNSGYMWFEGHGCLHTEQGKGRKCIILVGRERPVYTLSKQIVRQSGGIGDNELWTKMSTSGMFLFVSSHVRQLLDRQPEELVGTSIQALMRQDSKAEFGKILELARMGRKGEVKHEMINKRGQVLQAFTTIYPGDAVEGQKPTFLVAQTRLLKYSRGHGQRPSIYPKQDRHSGDSQGSVPSTGTSGSHSGLSGTPGSTTPVTNASDAQFHTSSVVTTFAGNHGLAIGHQDHSLASEDNVFDELKTTRSTSWQYELRQMEKQNRYLAEEVQSLLAAKKKRKRRKGAGQLQKDCANCHTRTTPEWRRGPSGNRDLCNSCGLRWAKQVGRVSPRASSQHSQSDNLSKKSASPRHNQTILPNVMQAAGTQSSISSSLGAPGKRSPQQHSSADSHAAKISRMEVAASQGLSGGIPARIDEGIEPE